MFQTFQNVCDVDGPDPTYIAAFTAFSPGVAATTDILTLAGSATQTVRVLQVGLFVDTATAAAEYDVQLVRRSTAGTGGTATTVTGRPLDKNDAAATAVAKIYTVAPTAGTLVGLLWAKQAYVPVAPAIAASVLFDFSALGKGGKALILRGTTDVLAVNLNGATPANALSIDGYVVWTERLGSN